MQEVDLNNVMARLPDLIEVLPIRLEHLDIVSTLPFHHRDPFDRLLVAQALAESIPVISIDDTLG